jgi:predicted nucleotidyltransferase
MISEQDIAVIRRTSFEYGLKRVLLFGSAARPDAKPRDIDIAVEGLDPRRFFEFYGDLLFALSLPVDVFDLSQSGRFADLVRREGVSVYG